MSIRTIVLTLSFLATITTSIQAQNGQPNSEKIWKDLSRLPENLRDDLKASAWWKSTPAGKTAANRLDSVITSTHFGSGKTYPLNKTVFEYTAPRTSVQSDFVNYGQWILQKRSTVIRDDFNRIKEVLEEEPDPEVGQLQATTKFTFFWRGKSDTECDSIHSNRWDESEQQWLPALRLYSSFGAKGQETATETYRYNEDMQMTGVREEYQFDAAGDVTSIRQFLLKDGKWAVLGKVESSFDQQHREIARQEDIALKANEFVPVRKLSRNYDAQGILTREERSKWNESSKQWVPLKAVGKGVDAKKRSTWTVTESYKPNAFFKSRVETFPRKNDSNTDREVKSAFKTDSNKWEVLSETQYYYSK